MPKQAESERDLPNGHTQPRTRHFLTQISQTLWKFYISTTTFPIDKPLCFCFLDTPNHGIALRGTNADSHWRRTRRVTGANIHHVNDVVLQTSEKHGSSPKGMSR